MADPPATATPGHRALSAPTPLTAQVLASAPRFEPESPLPTLISGDIALTSTVARDGTAVWVQVARRQPDGTGVRVQVARRQPDGNGLRLLDQPELSPDA